MKTIGLCLNVSLTHLLLGVEDGVGVGCDPLHQDPIPGYTARGRGEYLHLVWGRGAHHHGLGHDTPGGGECWSDKHIGHTRVSPHLAGLEVAEDHHHPVLHLSLGDELDQARDHSPEQIEIK